MPTELERDLAFAVEVAWRAGRAALARFRTEVVTEHKLDGSPVTAADREAEGVARELIQARYPGDGILGEEFGELRPGASRRWIIDPIDGTRAFVRGVPLYGVLVALELEGRPVLGVIRIPALGETVSAARGSGCWWNGYRVRVSETAQLDQALVCTSDVATIARTGRLAGWNRLVARGALTRTWGDCYGYALVATGRAEAMLDPVMAVWDAAALVPIIEEAGGVITDWDGTRSYTSGHVVATNAHLAEEIRRLLAGEGEGEET
jgi:histidinol phosphatase-like enzyme (inositol monophosphatase family)